MLFCKRMCMKKNKNTGLDISQLCRRISAKELNFNSTDDLEPLVEFLGQERAVQALLFGIGIQASGYNLFAMGPPGIGKRSLITRILEEEAPKRTTPSDWCYIHNFKNPSQPLALCLPTGVGLQLQEDMKQLIQEASKEVLKVFESEEYAGKIQLLTKKLNESFQKKYQHKLPRIFREIHQKENDIQKEIVNPIVNRLFNKMRKQYAQYVEVTDYLNTVENDILTHLKEFVRKDENTQMYTSNEDNPNYKVNAFVNHRELTGAPIVFEENPCYSNLICRVEHTTQNGALTTNFTLLKPGSLHKANGGFLIIDAKKFIKNTDAWEALKRALYTKIITIEPIDNVHGHTPLVSLEPSPIPLNVKVILIGERRRYYSLSHKETDFGQLFKVIVDFDDQIDRNAKSIKRYARLIATIVQREKLKPFTVAAIATLLEYSSRLAEDAKKLSTHFGCINNLIFESDYWAGQKNKKMVDKNHVLFAIAAKNYRLDRSRDIYFEEIYRHFVIIATRGSKVGQVNALSVVRVGKHSYGHPTRITAITRMGKGKIIDIQREIKLAGAIYAKGSLIISNFLAGRYILDEIFSLYASISFEQIYGRIDGDSASIAEVCALLSSLANIPLKQYLSVTGSMDQYGEAQVIGGVNNKIEGFFHICQMQGLTGNQGVLIPEDNVPNLMLDNKVIEAVKKNKFYIYTYKTIDEAMYLLTDIPAGKKIRGHYPKNSINYLVEERLKEYSHKYRRMKKIIK